MAANDQNTNQNI